MKKITKLGKIELCPALIKSLSFADAECAEDFMDAEAYR